MPPTPTYGDRSHDDPSLPDEDAPARRSNNRTTPDQPAADKDLTPPLVKPGQPTDQ